ncbi:hypothetical protein N0V83_004272 [Neocucurbitaria cava]|uniref:Calcineurin-like phosphoesterase domain-containing protein n=1 Tax=Neocucurbitaria cava TaxID=798079 RepID=A0A9W8YDW4_9PLEO|nr:hypothetical protein N0V83_004272 [Neocucurbitaria cava]
MVLLIFVADPQLIDPHTYPGRPWPLNPLTYKYTDLYLRRTYSRFQTVLYPDTIFFLGDLFDGGREWSTRTTSSPEEQYRIYGDDFWMKEYVRFGDLFFKHWGDGGMKPRPGQPGRKIISSLPGNHDLGFAKGVQIGVRNRFNAYFGDGNRIDVIANHTFVSLDSVSLSALGQDTTAQQAEEIWRPTKDFLESAKKQKKRLVQRDLRVQQGLRPYPGFPHYAIESKQLPTAELPHANDDVTQFPTILLTHVPLYRAPGTPCGPLREHWPPTAPAAGQPPLEHDDRNAIAVRGGYQYQNVLNREITADIAEKIGDIRYAFSGDDHDYCEVLHRGYASAGGGIREITVKSISWAMGVRHPGVVLLSLWNPVDALGNPLSEDASRTVQTHLCLLPDQIGTFLRYGVLFGLTVTLLVIRAALVTFGVVAAAYETSEGLGEAPLLPTTSTTTSSAEHEKASLQFSDSTTPFMDHHDHGHHHSSNSSTSSGDRAAAANATLQVRSAQARTARSVSPSTSSSAASYALPTTSQHTSPQQPSSQYSYPLVQHAGYYGSSSSEEHHNSIKENGGVYRGQSVSTKRRRTRRKGLSLFAYEVRWSLARVCVCGIGWYAWLVWRG